VENSIGAFQPAKPKVFEENFEKPKEKHPMEGWKKLRHQMPSAVNIQSECGGD
jgi:hypothetical protein